MKSVLKWLIPPISEMEYLYFVSLFMFSVMLQIITHFQEINDYLFETGNFWDGILSISELFIATLVVLILMLRMAVKAVQSDKPAKTKHRAGYVMSPLGLIVLLGPWSILIGTNDAPPQSVFAVAVAAIVTIRYICLLFVIIALGDSTMLKKFAASRFNNYQMTTNQSASIILLGLAGAIVVLFTQNWLAWMITIYGIGCELLVRYRNSTS